MTREHKLALIIGFSLVLVVGVLISDHFSKAREDQMATVTEDRPSRFGSDLPNGLKPVSMPPASLAGTNHATALNNPDSPLPPTEEAAAPRANEIVLNPFGTPPVAMKTTDVETSGQEPQAGMGGPGQVRPVRSETLSPQQIPGFEQAGSQTTQTPQQITLGGPKGNTQTPGSGTAAPVKEEVINGVPRSMLTRHDVKDGESIYRIAAEKYGDGTLWTKLRDFNPGKIASNGSMRAGVTILCPPKEYMLGKPLPTPGTVPTVPGVVDKPAPTAVASKQTKPESKVEAKEPAKAEKTAKTGTYKVQRGDHLGEIAAKLLGSSKRATEIYEMNKDVMSDEDSLTVGMTLKLPTR